MSKAILKLYTRTKLEIENIWSKMKKNLFIFTIKKVPSWKHSPYLIKSELSFVFQYFQDIKVFKIAKSSKVYLFLMCLMLETINSTITYIMSYSVQDDEKNQISFIFRFRPNEKVNEYFWILYLCISGRNNSIISPNTFT